MAGIIGCGPCAAGMGVATLTDEQIGSRSRARALGCRSAAGKGSLTSRGRVKGANFTETVQTSVLAHLVGSWGRWGARLIE